MKLVDTKKENVYNKKVLVETTVAELMVIIAVIGTAKPDEVIAKIRSSYFTRGHEELVTRVEDRMHYDLYDDLEKVLRTVAGGVVND